MHPDHNYFRNQPHMFTTYYSLAVDLLRRYLGERGNVSLELFSDTDTHFAVDGRPVLLSANDASIVTVKFGRDPHSHAFTVDMTLFAIKLPAESVPPKAASSFREIVDSELQKARDFESWAKRDVAHKSVKEPAGNFSVAPALSAEQVSSLRQGFQKPPDMPDFEDEYEIKGKHSVGYTPQYPKIGDADLHPAGLNGYPTLQPHLDPLRENPHGGMYLDRNHSFFGRTDGCGRPGVPPGARYSEPYSEGNMEDMGMGLPEILRKDPPKGFGGPGNPAAPGFGGGFGGGFP
ncbi:hypothetical protein METBISCDRAFT_28311 [Metschnikowia bicuspidata]|uniref:PI31 proteasome regulator C-terminal domain-containing protein n=1 Tax=Metschnikowia bicuspidata TaxID=27322 RepID=A0A4P9ZAJ9_9ASCO|nr:hypothetical protein METBISCDRAFT_28311 [Metschnikowia bicuspidata]